MNLSGFLPHRALASCGWVTPKWLEMRDGSWAVIGMCKATSAVVQAEELDTAVAPQLARAPIETDRRFRSPSPTARQVTHTAGHCLRVLSQCLLEDHFRSESPVR